jgi:hypothetical protein
MRRQLKGKPRNKPAKLEADDLHGLVRDLVQILRCTCPHCRQPPTAKTVLQYLPEQFQDRTPRTISTHIRDAVAELDKE